MELFYYRTKRMPEQRQTRTPALQNEGAAAAAAEPASAAAAPAEGEVA